MNALVRSWAAAHRAWMLVPALALLALGVIACEDDADPDTDTGTDGASPTVMITATATAEGTDTPAATPTATPTSEADADVGEEQIGQSVTVRGEVDTIYSERLFSVSGDEILELFGGSTTLVVVESAAGFDAATLEEGQAVEVSGTGVRLVVEDIEEDMTPDDPFTDEESSAVEDFEDGDVGVLADSVTIGE